MANKREPTLADRFISQPAYKPTLKTPLQSMRWVEGLQRRTRLAEKFVFDREASERVGLVLRDVPELLVEQIQFVRPPFELCWIEYELDPIFELLNPGKNNVIDQTRDKKIGILIDHNRITVTSLTHNNLITVTPFAYHLNTEWALEDQLAFCDKLKISRLGIDVWLWGALGAKFMNEGKHQFLRVLRDTNMVECMIKEELTFEQAGRMMSATTGDFKNHVAVLLMLNQPSLTQYVRIPSTRGWISSKPRPYMAYNTVRVALDPVPKIRTLSENPGSGELRRRHRVRGHYCHNEAARKAIINHTCEHCWQATNKRWELLNTEVGDDIENWLCGLCGGHRWWREEHERGDAGKGYVDHTYEVTRHEGKSTG